MNIILAIEHTIPWDQGGLALTPFQWGTSCKPVKTGFAGQAHTMIELKFDKNTLLYYHVSETPYALL